MASGAAVQRPEKTEAIVRAVFAELGDRGWNELTMDSVAARAGVGKPALYRRWPSKDEMLMACVIDAGLNAALPADTGNLRDDLLGFTRQAVDYIADPHIGKIIAAVLAAMSSRTDLAAAMLDRFRAPRRAAAHAALARAVTRGEISANTDFDLITDLLAGPLYMYAIQVAGPVPAGYPEQLVDTILKTLR